MLRRVLLLNLAVAAAKIAFGAATGTVSILSDGFHSLTDGASNVVALVGVHVAAKPPDEDHPYGHRKFETLAAVGIGMFLLLVMLGVVQTAWDRLRGGAAPDVTPWSFAVMLVTLGVNLFVVAYESRAGRRLRSEVLVADARHTRSDVLTSLTVVAALVGMHLGIPLLDPIAALVVAVFIGLTGVQIARDTSSILSDRSVMDEDQIRAVVMGVPGLLGCHEIRTRGTADYVFLDMHIWLAPETTLFDAHAASHAVKDRLMQRFPEIADAVIHIEPPPARS
ncbi:MAG: cation diffusion facilitator family transporter [Vicinamibacteraceae bacterium]|nr:cation diffusion facilitator family transporter [Vicinamibacteraceae bacterium]